ncbi:hypothetical protein BVC80_9009g25 [Macleaya cordata]|uniref:Uncharacterized protein n=1 Tax=Macleaya cordata TaxID=56857 RepID=A0A200QM42_MACCD|nr:hypothetical protein BVC80_9009g25 [Macleaya cordata]
MLVPSSSGSSDANNLMSTPSSASAATPTYMPSLIRKMNSVSIAPSTNSSAARRSAINIRPLIRKMASVSISQSSSTIEPPGEEENLIRDAELYHYLSNLNSTRRHSSISIKNNMPPKQKRKPLIFSKVGIYCKCGKCHIITKVSGYFNSSVQMEHNSVTAVGSFNEAMIPGSLVWLVGEERTFTSKGSSNREWHFLIVIQLPTSESNDLLQQSIATVVFDMQLLVTFNGLSEVRLLERGYSTPKITAPAVQPENAPIGPPLEFPISVRHH